uniref:(northern house mosquito) hypothetical protein n=1 Tax=Culex pipiens TaxID=7175 RepID=A0A8D7ZU30_CULPI
MSLARKNTIFVDFRVLPTRPTLDSVKIFVEKSMGLDPAGLKCVQLQNTRNGVLIKMANQATATKAAADNHMKHAIRSGEKMYRIPVYVNDNDVDVRVHDLPPGMPNDDIANGMAQYGDSKRCAGPEDETHQAGSIIREHQRPDKLSRSFLDLYLPTV